MKLLCSIEHEWLYNDFNIDTVQQCIGSLVSGRILSRNRLLDDLGSWMLEFF